MALKRCVTCARLAHGVVNKLRVRACDAQDAWNDDRCKHLFIAAHTLVTNYTEEFDRVPDLKLENWTKLPTGAAR
jgi:hypothetical protein